MTKLNSLVEDIYSVLDKGVDSESKLHETLSESLPSLETLLKTRLTPSEVSAQDLRMSQIGSGCLRKLWYGKHRPEAAEKLEPHVRMKFLYGDIIEWLVLLLTRLAGHEVKGEQTELEIAGVKGHRDAIIDGRLVDVKSANSRGFVKFREHKLESDDPFGYMDQLNVYGAASNSELDDRQQASFLAVDKELGHIVLDTYDLDTSRDFDKELTEKKAIIDGPKIPDRGYSPVPHNKGGNMQLGVACRYCAFKKECHPGLRTFIYSSGPVFLTHVEKTPDVREV